MVSSAHMCSTIKKLNASRHENKIFSHGSAVLICLKWKKSLHKKIYIYHFHHLDWVHITGFIRGGGSAQLTLHTPTRQLTPTVSLIATTCTCNVFTSKRAAWEEGGRQGISSLSPTENTSTSVAAMVQIVCCMEAKGSSPRLSPC